jgi:hypothetical protein
VRSTHDQKIALVLLLTGDKGWRPYQYHNIRNYAAYHKYLLLNHSLPVSSQTKNTLQEPEKTSNQPALDKLPLKVFSPADAGERKVCTPTPRACHIGAHGLEEVTSLYPRVPP